MKNALFLKLTCLVVTGLIVFLGSQCGGAQIPPQQALIAKRAGDAYSQKGEVQKAIKAYEQALKDYPDYAEVYYLLGLIYDLQQGNIKKAITCYQKFLELAPNSPDAADVRPLLESAKGTLASTPSPTNKKQPEQVLSPTKEQPEQMRSSTEKWPSEKFVSRSINDKILKYSIKLMVWQREGYIDKFNKLALARGSSLTNDIAEKRAKLRQKRQKTTEFIDYAKEAERLLLRQMVNKFLKEVGIDLPQLPKKMDLQKIVPSSQILNIEEDKKYIHLSLKAQINVQNLKKQLLEEGYQFTPVKIQLQCSNLYGEFKDRFLEAIQRKSEYIKGQSEGLYEIYTTTRLFASELSKMMIGAYVIHLDQVAKNKIVFTAKSIRKQP